MANDASSANRLRQIEAIRNTLHDEMGRDESIVVYGQDVGENGGVFRATEGLIDEYPDRVYDFPVAEAGIVGMGVGLAAYGFTPVPEIEFSGFMFQAFHQIQQHAARLRTRTRGEFNCPMTIRAPYAGGIRALEHHSESFEAGYAHTAGLKVAIPATPADAKGLLTASIRDPDPVIFLEPTRLYRVSREPVPEGEYVVPLGEADVAREGDDVTVVAWGTMRHRALAVAEEMDASVEVIDPRTIVPFDTDAVLDSVRKTGRCVVVHEAPRTAGMGAEIAARINDRALLYLEAPVQRVTGYDVPYPLFAREDEYIPDEDRIRAGIEDALTF
jgi:pyruvate/2-oxoglutarate/acetoin dehydrogenase E1 component